MPDDIDKVFFLNKFKFEPKFPPPLAIKIKEAAKTVSSNSQPGAQLAETKTDPLEILKVIAPTIITAKITAP